MDRIFGGVANDKTNMLETILEFVVAIDLMFNLQQGTRAWLRGLAAVVLNVVSSRRCQAKVLISTVLVGTANNRVESAVEEEGV